MEGEDGCPLEEVDDGEEGEDGLRLLAPMMVEGEYDVFLLFALPVEGVEGLGLLVSLTAQGKSSPWLPRHSAGRWLRRYECQRMFVSEAGMHGPLVQTLQASNCAKRQSTGLFSGAVTQFAQHRPPDLLRRVARECYGPSCYRSYAGASRILWLLSTITVRRIG